MQIAYREVIKELLPENLYLSKNELRVALEEYLAENAENYISTIGKTLGFHYSRKNFTLR